MPYLFKYLWCDVRCLLDYFNLIPRGGGVFVLISRRIQNLFLFPANSRGWSSFSFVVTTQYFHHSSAELCTEIKLHLKSFGPHVYHGFVVWNDLLNDLWNGTDVQKVFNSRPIRFGNCPKSITILTIAVTQHQAWNYVQTTEAMLPHVLALVALQQNSHRL